MTTQLLALRLSMAFLWLLSGITSMIWGRTIGEELLLSVGLNSWQVAGFIYGGSFLDVVLGIWLLLGWQLHTCIKLQLAVILVYSLLLSVVATEFWLHPFGPLSKNIPLLVLLWLGLSIHRENK